MSLFLILRLRAKVHLKNCLFYRETDIYILIHLGEGERAYITTIDLDNCLLYQSDLKHLLIYICHCAVAVLLIAEGRIHEAKFYVTRYRI